MPRETLIRSRRARRLLLAALLAMAGSGTVAASDIASDPMRPDTLRGVSSSAPARYRVNAIIVSDERRIAIVNGQRVGIGESIGEATVVSISRAEVVLEIDGRRQSLHVKNGAGQ